MKIAFRAVESFLSRPDGGCRAALVYGPDQGLVCERARRIRQTVLAGGDDPFACVEIEEAKVLADPALLADELGAISLMGGKRLIIVQDGGDKLTKIIEGASGAFHEGVFLLVVAGDLSSRSSLRAWFDKAAAAASLPCYRDEARDIENVVRQAFAAAGIIADREIVEYLAGQLGNDRGVTRQEVEKIITFAGENKKINLEEIQALVDYNRDSGLDDVVAAVADKDLKALEQAIAVELRAGVSPVAYLRALQRYFNRLYYVRAQMAAGQDAGAVISGLKPPVFFKQLPIFTRHVQQWDLSHIVKALKLLIEAEILCKTSDLPPAPASHRKLMQATQIR